MAKFRSDRSNRTESADDVPRALRWRRGIERAVTLAALLGIVTLGWSAIRGAGRLFEHSPLEADDTTSRGREESPQEVVLDAIQQSPDDGYWEMAGWQWQAGVRRVADADVVAELQLLAEHASPPLLPPQERQEIEELLSWLRRLPLQTTDTDGRRVYRLDERRLKLQVATVDDIQGETIASLSGAMQQPSGDWKLFELRGRPRQPSQNTKPMLPLDARAERVCARVNDAGVVQLEMLRTEDAARDLLTRWRDAGWKVHPVTGAPSDFHYLCSRDGETVHAWSPGRQASGGRASVRLLALVRVTRT